MSYVEKEKLIKADIASIENRVRHAFNQGYDLGFKDGKKKAKPLEQEPTTENCESCRYYGSHHEVCNYCYKCSLWTEKEPTTKNDIPHCQCADSEIAKSFIEDVEAVKDQLPTTKNDLGVENDLVSSIVEKISEKAKETREEFIFETIRPYCENVVQMKISKRDLEQALLKYYGKNDLGVDDEERELALMYLEQIKDDYIEGVGYERHPLPEYYAIETAIKSLVLPSVTPQEPCDRCEVTFKDDNAVSRLSVRDIIYANAYELEYPDGSSEYVVNRDELIKYLMELPPVYSKMVEPQESEG